MSLKLYPVQLNRVTTEVLIDPHSGFWYYHQEVDQADPLDILIRCEDGDEEALDLMYGQHAPKGL